MSFLKPIKWISAVLSIVLVVAGTLSFFKYVPPKKASVSIADDNVRIMSFNIRMAEYTARKDIVPGLIEKYYPDSVGVQECTYKWMNTLKNELEDYEFVGVGRDNGTQDKKCGEISAVLYLKEKYTLVDSGTFWLSETPDIVSRGWDGACNRVCTWVVLENKETGKQYAHVNTHLDHLGAEARTKGVALVTEKAMSFNMPTVLTGDFNFEEGCELYHELVSTGMSDSKYLASDSDRGFTFHAYFPAFASTDKPIDYICVNNLVKQVNSYKVITEKLGNRFVSDHYPIYSDMILY